MNNRERFTDRLKHLLPHYCGIGKRSDRFVGFLRARGASEPLVRMFEHFSFSGQIELDNGIVFAENEIIARNEFIEGGYFVFGADDEYAPLVVGLETCETGTVGADADVHRIDAASVVSSHVLLSEFLAAHAIGIQGDPSPYCAARHFNVDAVAIMKAFSGHAGMSVARTSSRFRRWLESVGIGKTFPLCEVAPKTAFLAGECTIGSEREIIEANYEERRRTNSRFVCIGTCPDGCLVVLDTSTPEPSVGYVAIMEIGDEPGWENHYVRVSNSLGEFLHDSNFLNIIPCDYYQALKLGYRQCCDELHYGGANEGMQSVLSGNIDDLPCSRHEAQDVPFDEVERRLSSGEWYRAFSGIKSLSAHETAVARLLPSTSRDIWLSSSAGFGEIDYQVSCLVDEEDFRAFAESLCGAGLMPSRDSSMCCHKQPECSLFQIEREKLAGGSLLHGDDGDNRYLSCDVPLMPGRRHGCYCYDIWTQSLAFYFGRI